MVGGRTGMSSPADHHRRCSSSPIDSRFYLPPITLGALRQGPWEAADGVARPLASPSPIWKDLSMGCSRGFGGAGQLHLFPPRGGAGAVDPPRTSIREGCRGAPDPASPSRPRCAGRRRERQCARYANQAREAVQTVAEVRGLTTMITQICAGLSLATNMGPPGGGLARN